MIPHPQRCDTCENTSCEYWEIYPHMSARHDRDTGWTASPGVITLAVGCASHSGIPNTPAPAADHAKQENISDHPELKLPPTKEWTLGMVYAFEAGLEEGRKKHDATIARKARWNVLDVIKTHIGEYRSYRKDGSIEWSFTIDPDDLDTFIESLRLTQQQAGDQHE